jgi:hypothetical protein
MRLPHLPPKYARLAKRVEEVAALLDCGPLRLLSVVVGDGDAEAEKARILAAHLAAHPQDAGRPIEWSTIHIDLVSPAIEIEAPRDREVHYIAGDGRLTLTNAEGEPIEIDGRRFSRPLGPDDDEVAAAEQLAREAHLGS